MQNEILKTISVILPKNIDEFRIMMSAFVLPLAPLLGSLIFGFFDDEYFYKLRKPHVAPSKLWAALYFMMGYAHYLAWRATPLGGGCLFSPDQLKAYVTGAPGFFWLHMFLNYGSSWVFFKFHDLEGTLIATTALTMAASFVAYRFYLLDQTAALLMIPYLLVLIYDTYDIYLLSKKNKSAETIKKNK